MLGLIFIIIVLQCVVRLGSVSDNIMYIVLCCDVVGVPSDFSLLFSQIELKYHLIHSAIIGLF